MTTLNKEKIRSLREQKGASLSEMSEKIFISKSMLGQIETGARIPNANILKAIAEYLSVTTDNLFDSW